MAGVLFTLFDGGGNVSPILTVSAEMARRGHRVSVAARQPSEPGFDGPRSRDFVQRIEATGAQVLPLVDLSGPPSTPAYRGLIGVRPGRLAPTRQAWGWAPNVVKETFAAIQSVKPDVAAVDDMMAGCLVAAEAARVPTAVLVHRVYGFPAAGRPAPGPGFMPMQAPVSWLRDVPANWAARRLWRRDALPPLNQARRMLGLAPLAFPLDQHSVFERVLVMTHKPFDFASGRLPSNVRYVGYPREVEPRPNPWSIPWPADDLRPLVIVSVSTNVSATRQKAMVQNIADAFVGLPARGLFTLAGVLRTEEFTVPDNVYFSRYVPHAEVMPLASAVVTHCGHGTTMEALANGVPVVCMPDFADRFDNAARVVAARAGVRISHQSPATQIRVAISRVLSEPRFREGAQGMAKTMAAEDGAKNAADQIEALVRQPS